jgi:hypothetical protein
MFNFLAILYLAAVALSTLTSMPSSDIATMQRLFTAPQNITSSLNYSTSPSQNTTLVNNWDPPAGTGTDCTLTASGGKKGVCNQVKLSFWQSFTGQMKDACA